MNFEFLKREDGYYDLFADAAIEAEKVFNSSGAMCAIGCRKALELAVRWVYGIDNTLQQPYKDNLQALLHDSSFKWAVDSRIWPQLQFVVKLGNQAVHTEQRISPQDAMTALKILFSFVDWIDYSYGPDYRQRAFVPEKVPAVKLALDVRAIKERESLLEEREERIKELEAKLEQISAQVTAAKAENQEARAFNPDEISEYQTRKLFIDVDLQIAGWELDRNVLSEYEVDGMTGVPGQRGYIDYLLLGKDGKPLAILEAKRTMHSPDKGLQQARLYSECLERKFGYKPMIFLSNGYETFFCDDTEAPYRPVSGVFGQGDLATMMNRRGSKADLATVKINEAITNRYYQIEAIRRVCANIQEGHRKSLLVMATGTGKTRVSASIYDVLARGNHVKNALFLADRIALVSQAKHAFQEYLPETSMCNLCSNRDDRSARVVFSTYQTILNAIDSARCDDGARMFTPAHFDLIIVDEAHRSIFRKYRAIFDYFDALVIGLTATPANEVDRNTYDFFEVERGVPTYVYEYSTAVEKDHVLVPYYGIETHTDFLDDGICYDDLTPEEQEAWEEAFGESGQDAPEYVTATEINSWVFNQDTTDKVLQTLMEQGARVDGGQTLGKTIIFAQNQRHAEYIVERFGKLYPTIAAGGYIKKVSYADDYSHTIIDEFKVRERPVITVSVDMMDTGIDVPEVLNLVFFKKVRSKIKFWQMIGRGTRLCEELQVLDSVDGEYAGKRRFFIFDWCRNFEFFGAGGDFGEGRLAGTVAENVFCRQTELIKEFQSSAYAADEYQEWRQEMVSAIRYQVVSLVPESDYSLASASVRLKKEYVERYSHEPNYMVLSDIDVKDLQTHIAPLVTNEEEDSDALRFDSLMYGFMCSMCSGAVVKGYESRILRICENLERKITIPQVKAKLAVIQRVGSEGFFEGIDLLSLEKLRIDLRELVKFVDKPRRKAVFTNVEDTITSQTTDVTVDAGEDFSDYRLKVNRFLNDYGNNTVIHKLHYNMPMTQMEFDALERIFTHELGTQADYERAYGEEPFGLLVRKIVKLDHDAAMDAFASFMNDNVLNADQIAFVHRVADYIELNGFMEPGELTRAPFDRPFSFIKLFDAKQQMQLVQAIRKVKENAVTPAA